MKAWLLGILAVAVLATGGWYLADDSNRNTREAVRAAEAWLELVDMGGYGESWDMASQVLKDSASRFVWSRILEGKRTAFGSVDKRTIREVKLLSEEHGIKGILVVRIECEVLSMTCETCKEEILCILESDGQWRVARYAFGQISYAEKSMGRIPATHAPRTYWIPQQSVR